MAAHDSTDAALSVRRRYDLVIAETGSVVHPVWTVKDPVSLRYFHIRAHDYFVFQQLDGTSTVEEIEQRFYTLYAPDRLNSEQIRLFVQRLWNQGLVTVENFGASTNLTARSRYLEQRERNSFFTNVLAIRFRGFDPDRFLTSFVPSVGWIFSPICFVLAFVLIAPAVGLVLTEWETLYRELPSFGSLFSAERVIWFAVVIGSVKVFHELGHAFACKRFGGECRELGLMFLVFTPCLYCNVSDAWLLKNRRHRIIISAAGIYVELVLAAICTYLWWWSVPGVVHSICLYVMVVSSLNTLLLNGNPLLRYDGYYVLTDLVNIPNLRSRSQVLVQEFCMRLFFGIRQTQTPHTNRAQTAFLYLYGFASSIYLYVVMFGILWMLYHVAQPHGLEAFVVAAGTVMIVSRCYSSFNQLVQYIRNLQQQGDLVIGRFVFVLLGCGSIASIGLLMPVPRHVKAPLLIEAVAPHSLIVTLPGKMQVDTPLHPGQRVSEGDLLLRLNNPDEELQLEKLSGEVLRQTRKLELLKSQQANDPGASSRIPSETAALNDYQARLKRRQDEAKRLIIIAPKSGILLPSKTTTSPESDSQLQQVEGPLELYNQSAWLPVETVIAEIADPTLRQAVLYVDQADVALLKIGDTVRFSTSQLSGDVRTGKISEISSKPVETLPETLIALNSLPTQLKHSHRPLNPIHEVRVELDLETPLLLIRQPGQATIHVGNETLLDRLSRVLRRTFTFEL